MNYVINPDSTNTATVLAKAQADAVPTSRKQHPKGEGVTDAGSHPELTEESVRAAGHRWRACGGRGGQARGSWGALPQVPGGRQWLRGAATARRGTHTQSEMQK